MKDGRILIVQPMGGLCNRMWATDAAITLAQRQQRSLWLLWVRDRSLNAGFSALFEPLPDGVNLVDVTGWINQWPVRQLLASISKHLFKMTLYDESQIASLMMAGKVEKELQFAQRLYLRTYSRFITPDHPNRVFQPQASIRETIARYSVSDLVGVHVRRTDNRKAIEHSPLQGFIEAMREELMQNADTRFFLATDEPAVEHILREEFPNRIVVHAKRSLAREKSEAIEDALIDLFLLGGCRRLIGSYWSTFTITASELGSGCCRVIGADQEIGN